MAICVPESAGDNFLNAIQFSRDRRSPGLGGGRRAPQRDRSRVLARNVERNFKAFRRQQMCDTIGPFDQRNAIR